MEPLGSVQDLRPLGIREKPRTNHSAQCCGCKTRKAYGAAVLGSLRWFGLGVESTQRLHSSSFLGLPYRILYTDSKKELLWSLRPKT